MVCSHGTTPLTSLIQTNLKHAPLSSPKPVLNWFTLLPPPTRIEFVCNLLQLFTAPELRFFGSCLEDLARVHYDQLIDFDKSANNPHSNEIDWLRHLVYNGHNSNSIQQSGNVKSEEKNDNRNTSIILTHRLLVSSLLPKPFTLLLNNPDLTPQLALRLSLLKSTNTSGADSFFKALTCPGIETGQSMSASSSNDTPRSRLPPVRVRIERLDEISLIYALAAFHPAFSFSQRHQLYGMLRSLLRWIDQACNLSFNRRRCYRRYPHRINRQLKMANSFASPSTHHHYAHPSLVDELPSDSEMDVSVPFGGGHNHPWCTSSDYKHIHCCHSLVKDFEPKSRLDNQSNSPVTNSPHCDNSDAALSSPRRRRRSAPAIVLDQHITADDDDDGIAANCCRHKQVLSRCRGCFCLSHHVTVNSRPPPVASSNNHHQPVRRQRRTSSTTCCPSSSPFSSSSTMTSPVMSSDDDDLSMKPPEEEEDQPIGLENEVKETDGEEESQNDASGRTLTKSGARHLVAGMVATTVVNSQLPSLPVDVNEASHSSLYRRDESISMIGDCMSQPPITTSSSLVKQPVVTTGSSTNRLARPPACSNVGSTKSLGGQYTSSGKKQKHSSGSSPLSTPPSEDSSGSSTGSSATQQMSRSGYNSCLPSQQQSCATPTQQLVPLNPHLWPTAAAAALNFCLAQQPGGVSHQQLMLLADSHPQSTLFQRPAPTTSTVTNQEPNLVAASASGGYVGCDDKKSSIVCKTTATTDSRRQQLISSSYSSSSDNVTSGTNSSGKNLLPTSCFSSPDEWPTPAETTQQSSTKTASRSSTAKSGHRQPTQKVTSEEVIKCGQSGEVSSATTTEYGEQSSKADPVDNVTVGSSGSSSLSSAQQPPPLILAPSQLRNPSLVTIPVSWLSNPHLVPAHLVVAPNPSTDQHQSGMSFLLPATQSTSEQQQHEVDTDTNGRQSDNAASLVTKKTTSEDATGQERSSFNDDDPAPTHSSGVASIEVGGGDHESSESSSNNAVATPGQASHQSSIIDQQQTLMETIAQQIQSRPARPPTDRPILLPNPPVMTPSDIVRFGCTTSQQQALRLTHPQFIPSAANSAAAAMLVSPPPHHHLVLPPQFYQHQQPLFIAANSTNPTPVCNQSDNHSPPVNNGSSDQQPSSNPASLARPVIPLNRHPQPQLYWPNNNNSAQAWLASNARLAAAGQVNQLGLLQQQASSNHSPLHIAAANNVGGGAVPYLVYNGIVPGQQPHSVLINNVAVGGGGPGWSNGSGFRPQRPRPPISCFNCGQLGHKAVNCQYRPPNELCMSLLLLII